MEEQDRIPEWVDALGEQVAAGTEFQGVGHLEMRYSAPEENEWGVHLLALAPALFDVAEASDGGDEDDDLDDLDVIGEEILKRRGSAGGLGDDVDAGAGEIGYGVLHDCDLLSVQQSFDEVTALSVGHEEDGGLRLTLGGKTGGRDVVILLFTTPFEEMPEDEDDAPEEDA